MSIQTVAQFSISLPSATSTPEGEYLNTYNNLDPYELTVTGTQKYVYIYPALNFQSYTNGMPLLSNIPTSNIYNALSSRSLLNTEFLNNFPILFTICNYSMYYSVSGALSITFTFPSQRSSTNTDFYTATVTIPGEFQTTTSTILSLPYVTNNSDPLSSINFGNPTLTFYIPESSPSQLTCLSGGSVPASYSAWAQGTPTSNYVAIYMNMATVTENPACVPLFLDQYALKTISTPTYTPPSTLTVNSTNDVIYNSLSNTTINTDASLTLVGFLPIVSQSQADYFSIVCMSTLQSAE